MLGLVVTQQTLACTNACGIKGKLGCATMRV